MKHFYFLLIAVFFSFNLYAQQAPFITTWEVTAGSLNITIPTSGTGYNYTVDFGDGTVQNNVTGDASHTYAAPGTYTVTISGDFPRIRFRNFYNTFNNMPQKIKSIVQWGDIEWVSMDSAFMGCSSLIINASDAPDLSQVTTLAYMFSGASSLNQSINHWDVSNVTNMVGLFRNASSFNQPLHTWNVSNVTNMNNMFEWTNLFNQPINNWDVSSVSSMSSMFYGALSFNQPINNWDVSNVTNMVSMFRNATSFNQPLNNWDVSNVTTMNGLFRGATSFNQPLNDWDVSSVTNMVSMFESASIYNQPLDNWDVSNVTDMSYMFNNASVFNQPLNSWNVSNVINMRGMFYRTLSFNQPLNNWNVSNVTDMMDMFYNAQSFNQNIDSWNVSNVTIMNHMFQSAISFNQPLNNWDVSNVSSIQRIFKKATSFNQPLNNWNISNITSIMIEVFKDATSFNQDLSAWQLKNGSLSSFLSNAGLDIHNYDKFLTHLATLNFNNGTLGAHNLEYCNSGVRDYLINQLGWTINGDILSSDCNAIIGDILFDQNNNGCDPNDTGVHGFMINANDGFFDFTTFSSDGAYHLPITGTSFTVSVINTPSYFSISPASANVTFTGSNTEVLDFCVTANQTIEDLNITLLPPSEARPGFEADYRLVVRNVGTETIANVEAALEFDDLMQQFVIANPAPAATTANTLTFSVGTMQPFQTVEIDITMLTFPPPTVNGGDILNFTAAVTPAANDFTPNDNTFNLAQVVVNSFDPNDKQVLQGEELHIDDIGEYLDYLIRFQNTGTASAVNVRILDTLHPKLDWNTFTPISASHDYYIKITEGNRVEFMFDNIHLPDSLSNEPESHGFAAYKIKPKSNVQVGDVISGDAAIYFDFNAPIITNMVHTTVVEPLSTPDVPGPLNQIVLYPNPAGKTLHIHLTDGIELQEVLIYDLQGKEVKKFQNRETTLDVEHLSPGMYLLKITTNQGTINRQLIKN